MTLYSFEIDEKLYGQFIDEARMQGLTMEEALKQALSDWIENRQYLRSGEGERRFGAASKVLQEEIDARKKP